MSVKIIVDDREKSVIPKILDRMGAELTVERLPCADYVISNTTAFEYKSVDDFLTSEVGEEKMKLNRQIHDLVESYKKPALLIGGTLAELLTRRKIHENSIMAFLQAILWQGAAIRFLSTPEIVANYIYETARKEQDGIKKPFSPHGMKTKRKPKEQKEYVISSIPDIGGATAKSLLTMFGSVEGVMTAPKEKLMALDGIGEVTAAKIREICGGQY